MNNTQPPFLPLTDDADSIDLKKYIFKVLRNWYWFALSLAIGYGYAYFLNRYSPKVYQATCTLVIGEEGSKTGSAENILEELSRVRRVKRAVVENEVSILRSYRMTNMALQELDFGITYTAVGKRGIAESKLYRNNPFVVLPDTSLPNINGYRIDITVFSDTEFQLYIDDKFKIDQRMRFGEPFRHPSFNFTIYLKPEYATHFNNGDESGRKFYLTINNLNSLTNSYRARLGIELNSDRGSIANLTMTGPEPGQITDFLNKICEVYIRSNLNDKNLVSDNTIRFIDAQLRGIIDSLETAGIRLQNFRSANKIMDLSREGSFLYQQMERLNSEQALLEMRSRYYAYLQDYLNKRLEFSDIIAPAVAGVEDRTLGTLVDELNKLYSERRRFVYSGQENLPPIRMLDSQVATVKKTLLENLSSLVATNNLSINDVKTRVGRVEAEFRRLPFTERQLINIQREFNINDQIYTFLLQKRAEAGISKASNTPDHKVLDIARPENVRVIKPKTSTNTSMALMIGFLIPLMILVLLEYFNNKIVDRKDIENNTRVPVVGSIGHNDEENEIPLANKPRSVMAESFRALRTNLNYILKEKGQNTICVTSAVSGEGKTFCAVNLALAYALTGKKTLLVSLDMRRPKIHKLFDLHNKKGLSTYLIGKSNYDEIILETAVENLYVAVSGPIPPNPAELTGSDALRRFFSQAKQQYNHIIIDSPPVAMVTDALLLKDLTDSFIFVIRHGYTSRQVLQIINDLYQLNDLNNMALIVNDIDAKGLYTYKYGYSYDYGYYSGGYYDDDEAALKHRRSRFRHWLKSLPSKLFR